MRWLLLLLISTVVSQDSSAELHLSEAAGNLYEKHVLGDKNLNSQVDLLQYRMLSSADKAALQSLEGSVTSKGGRRRRHRRCSRRGNSVRWGGGRKRVGRNLYGQRMLYRWNCNRWQYVRWWWALLKRNAYNHRLNGRTKYVWTNAYKRIGFNKYRRQDFYRNYQGTWRRVRSFWRLNRKNAYYRKPRWFGSRHRQRRGRDLYRKWCYKRWTGAHWRLVKCRWRLSKRNAYRPRRRRRLCARLYEHSNFRGRVYNVYNNVRFLRGFNDKLSSMRVYNCVVRVYQHSNYRGRSHAFGRGNYNYNRIRRTIGNDQASSVRVWHRNNQRRRRYIRRRRVRRNNRRRRGAVCGASVKRPSCHGVGCKYRKTYNHGGKACR